MNGYDAPSLFVFDVYRTLCLPSGGSSLAGGLWSRASSIRARCGAIGPSPWKTLYYFTFVDIFWDSEPKLEIFFETMSKLVAKKYGEKK